MRCLRRTFNPLILVLLTVLGCVLLPRNLYHRESVVVEVDAARGWQGTGVHLDAGEVVTITQIGGAWSPWPGETFDAIGSRGTRAAAAT